MVQWVRYPAPNAGDLGSIPGQVTKSHMPQQRPGDSQINKCLKKKSLIKLFCKSKTKIIFKDIFQNKLLLDALCLSRGLANIFFLKGERINILRVWTIQ